MTPVIKKGEEGWLIYEVRKSTRTQLRMVPLTPLEEARAIAVFGLLACDEVSESDMTDAIGMDVHAKVRRRTNRRGTFRQWVERRSSFRLKLRIYSGLVYDRPNFLDPFVSKLIEYVFGKRNSLPVYMEAKQDSFRRAVEAQTARYTRWLGNQQMDVKIEVWNRAKISLQHLAIA